MERLTWVVSKMGRTEVFSGRYKAVMQGEHSGERQWCLYDMQSDLNEQNDLSFSRSEVMAELIALYNQHPQGSSNVLVRHM